MRNRHLVRTGLALVAVLGLVGHALAQKSSPIVHSVKVGDEEAKKLNAPLKEGVNKVAALKTGERVFVRLEGKKVVEMFAEDEKGKKIPGTSPEVRKLDVTGKIRFCLTIRKVKVCVEISGTQ